MNNYKRWAIYCLLLGIIVGLVGIASLLITLFDPSKRVYYNVGMSLLFLIASAFLLTSSFEFFRLGKKRSKFGKIKETLLDDLAGLIGFS